MTKWHLTRLAVPRSWNVPTKTNKYITRPIAGAHSLNMGISLNILVRDLLKLANTAKEVKSILNNEELIINGKTRKEPKYMVGFMDIISLPKLKKAYRIILNKKGKLVPVQIEEKEADIKLAKINNKIKIKGNKIQLNLSDGTNFLIEKDDFKTGSTVLISLKEGKIIDKIELKKGVSVMLTGGKHLGKIGTIESIDGENVSYKEGKESHLTLKKYAFVVGNDNPIITINE